MLLLCEWAVLFCLRLLTVPETWLIVRRWCITRFFSLLIGGLWKSPNWISPQFTSQDETGPSRMPPLTLFELVCEIERERGRECKENEKAIRVRPFCFCPTCTSFPACKKRRVRGIRGQSCYFRTCLAKFLNFIFESCAIEYVQTIQSMIQCCLDRKSDNFLFQWSRCSCL